MSTQNGAKLAVDEMIAAIGAEDPPEVDWDAVERKLFRRVRQGEGAKPVARAPLGIWQVLPFAAAAALVPVAFSLGTSGAPSHRAASAERGVDVAQMAVTSPDGAHSLGSLRTGDTVEATAAAITFAEPGRVRWTLLPDSKLIVRSPIQGDGASRNTNANNVAPGAHAVAGLDPAANGAHGDSAHSDSATPSDAPDMNGPRPGTLGNRPSARPGLGHVVRLERGSLRVEVSPDLAKDGLVDVLAVEVGNTRVAVHGTVFTVTVRNGEVLVEVEHGVVTVGPTGHHGATTGYQLPAGSRAAFSLDGGRRARWLGQDESTAPKAVAVLQNPTAAAPVPAANGATPLAMVTPPAEDTPAMMDPPPVVIAKPGVASKPNNVPDPVVAAAPEPAEPVVAATPPPKAVMTTGGVQSGLRRCFAQAHPSSSIDSPKLTASSTFTLKIRADGSVQAAQFSPPLPSIQNCAAFVWGATFASGGSDYTLTIPVQLSQ